MTAARQRRRVVVAASNQEVLAPPYEWTTAAFMALDHDAWHIPRMLARHRLRRYRAAVSGLGLLYATVTRTPEFGELNQAGQDQVTDAIFAATHSLLEVMQFGRTAHAKAVVTRFIHLDALLGKTSVKPVFPLPERVERQS